MNKTDVIWINPHKKKGRGWIDEMFSHLFTYYYKFMEETGEIPFNYAERSLVGHLAIAIEKANESVSTLQDYDAIMENPKNPKGFRYRPDLWLYFNKSPYNSYLFEVKRRELLLRLRKRRLLEEPIRRIIRDYQKSYIRKAKSERANYTCILVAKVIYCEEDLWKAKYQGSEDTYEARMNEFKEFTKKEYWKEDEDNPDFCVYYYIPAERLYGNLRKYWFKDSNKNKMALGVLWFGSFQGVKTEKNKIPRHSRESGNPEISRVLTSLLHKSLPRT